MKKSALLNNIRMTPKDEKQCADIHNLVEMKFDDWLLSSKLSSSEDLFDGLLDLNSFTSQIAFDECSRKENQRLLLDVEKDSEIRRAEVRKREEEIRGIAQQILAKNMRTHIVKKTSSFKYTIKNLLNIPSSYIEAMNEISSPVGSLKKLIPLLSEMPDISSNLIVLVNNPEFCRSIKRTPKNVNDLSAACGFLGMDGLRFLLPGMMLKSRLKFECSSFPMLAQKIWSYYVTSSNAGRMLLQASPRVKRQELEIMLSGSIVCMGMAAMHNQFSVSFDQVRAKLLDELRDSRNVLIYQAMFDIEPDGIIMKKLFNEHSNDIVEALVNKVDWGHSGTIRKAVLDQILNTHYEERTPEGIALGQGGVYARWFLLKNAKKVKDNPNVEKRVMFHSRLSMENARMLDALPANKLDLKEYIG